MFFEGIEYYQIPNFEGYYISKCGKVLSTRFKIPREMKANITRGYKRIQFRINKTGKNILVHRLLAMTFLEDYSEDLDVDHKDNNKTNNNLSNLRMATKSENARNKKNSIGVYRCFLTLRNTYYYYAYWCDETGKSCVKHFSVNKYGEALAYLLAYNLREEMVAKYYNRP